jgi:hypothetical protein
LQIAGTELAAGAKTAGRGKAALEAAVAMSAAPAAIASMMITHEHSLRKIQQKTYLMI